MSMIVLGYSCGWEMLFDVYDTWEEIFAIADDWQTLGI